MVNLYVRSFEKIDDVKMEFSVQITFRKCFSLSDDLKLKSDSLSPAKFDINGFQLPVVTWESNLEIKIKRKPTFPAAGSSGMTTDWPLTASVAKLGI